MLAKIADKVKFEFEQTFMFYLPRICEHCLNPSCAASCPSGAIYKRSEDGIVLVDQDRCRGWRMCVSGCPYKKVYFNHRTGKAEKCTFCFPRIEVGLPTVCSETCVGRLRYIGLVLYDADKVLEAASTPDDHGLYEAQREVFLDPNDPEVVREAERAGIPRDWIEAAQRSPIYALINSYKVALPLHPEYRTMPMVWYIPPLSPVVDVVRDTGEDAEDSGNLFAAIDALRIPIEYLAELFTAGDVAPVDGVLQEARRDALLHARHQPRAASRTPSIPAAVGMTEEEMYDMYRLLAIAKYDERYVIPPAHAEQAHSLEELATECAVSEYGGGNPEIFGEGSGGAHADRGGELPDAPGPADLRHHRLARGQGVTGQPAQLGRQGQPRPGCSRRAPTTRTRREPAPGARVTTASGELTPEQLHGRLAVGLAAARLPRRAPGRPARRWCGRPRRPAGAVGEPLRRSVAALEERRCRSSRPTTSRPSTAGAGTTCS